MEGAFRYIRIRQSIRSTDTTGMLCSLEVLGCLSKGQPPEEDATGHNRGVKDEFVCFLLHKVVDFNLPETSEL